ncbi:DNA binding domain, excisionase family [Mycobacteroides abscessus subsp. massiliense]|uniref:DNA-binding protein n=1 Tax=Mycobacteroides abscessus TaxID=36809 RepID=UPI0009A79647|nr:DNA-binding protein [Mycobacteroides abscessus]SKE69603.1 DNA binding domain, excisionase family [Mycobacteroides abscessus subsp. massiliense]SKH81323.1 DNA binding domain, excisionase family [Mycobacteroides abscessus subsp. massiliense]SKI34584.1 DNA binding domain, excisionase family [Mycobacteroides abscessus subsp. massiliense]SKJ35854.1 DNA binding domain, excisionase family [Mycobacteroides abscessus subsp. massiliense]SKK23985.1 DNA binding domain, excisionase family [Mycobacteroid
MSGTIRRPAPGGGTFITRPAAAALRGVTRRRIDSLIQNGDLPAYQVGTRVMVLESDVLALELPTVPPEGWITRHAAAKILGCTHRAVGLMVARGDLPAETINGRVYLREADVRKAATPRRVMPPRRR